MIDAKQIWSWWQSLLERFRCVFTGPGWVRFVQWVTGTVLCWEEHAITQILVSLGLESRWQVAEHFAEYGAWDRPGVERQTIGLIQEEHPPRWGRYHPLALDDTKQHRTSQDVWGTCTFHDSSARSPNRAETVRAHNWVVAGDLVPGRPWTFQVQMIAISLLRLMQFRLDAAWGKGSYWLKPEWNPRKRHPSILDLRRLFWRHRARIAKLLLVLEELNKSETIPKRRRKPLRKAA